MTKYLIPLCLFLSLLMIGCSGNGKLVELQSKVDSLTSVLANRDTTIKNQTMRIQNLRDSIMMLQFPADQRLAKIKQDIEAENFDAAKRGIQSLKSTFPQSQEATQCATLSESIETRLAAIEAEKERIKAQGFKVFKDNLSCSDNEENYSFSGFTFGRTFTFDDCDDVGEYSYRTADKDNTYLLFSLRLSTKKKYATAPNVYIYKVIGDKLEKVAYCMDEYASWTSYGAKIGNYSDDSHDFSKVNSVRYKYAGEIEQALAKKPLFVVFAKTGHRLEDNMTIDEVHDNCIVVKVINRNML